MSKISWCGHEVGMYSTSIGLCGDHTKILLWPISVSMGEQTLSHFLLTIKAPFSSRNKNMNIIMTILPLYIIIVFKPE